MEKLKKIKDSVLELMRKDARYCDDDNLLVAAYWFYAVPNLKDISGYEFILKYKDGKIPSADSITRVRRKIQEQHPELRGTTYNEKHHLAEKTKKSIHHL